MSSATQTWAPGDRVLFTDRRWVNGEWEMRTRRGEIQAVYAGDRGHILFDDNTSKHWADLTKVRRDPEHAV